MRRLGQKGFTLVELLITLALLTVVVGAIYGLYINSMKTTESQRLSLEMRQSASAALDFMVGDIQLAGYGIADSGASPDFAIYPGNTAIADADVGPKLLYSVADQFAFVFKDLAATTPNKQTMVRYRLSSGVLIRDSWNWGGALWNPSGASPVIDDVQAFNITYYNAQGAAIAPLTAVDRSKIRRVKIELTVRQSKKDPIALSQKTSAASVEVALVNMGALVTVDTTPPPTPTNLALSDPRICGMIAVTWTYPPVADLAYYAIEVTSNAVVSEYIALPTVTSARVGRWRVEADGSYTYPISNAAPASVKIRAFDTSGNSSAWSAPVSITPAADAPVQPLGLNATSTTIDPATVSLSWNGNSTTNPDDIDIRGYRVFRREYRSAAPFDAYAQIAAETLVASPSYTDNIAASSKCTTFDYKIQAVNSCNSSLVSPDSASAYGDGAGLGADSPAGANTRPSDSISPAAPTGPGAPVPPDTTGTVLSKAGYKRNFINWHNPSDADLAYVAMRYNNTLPPPDPVYPSGISGGGSGTGVEEISGVANSANVAGFAPGAVGLGVIHRGINTPTPSLLDGNKYAYSLFAVDKCGNISSAATTAQTTVSQCGEETTGPSSGAPRWNQALIGYDTAANFTVSGCLTDYTFSWSRIDDSAANIWDLAGYYVYKSFDNGFSYGKLSPVLTLNSAVGNISKSDLSALGYPDPDDNPGYIGNIYKYYVIPIDCNRETNVGGNPWATTDLLGSPLPAPPPPLNSTILTVAPGRVTLTKPDVWPASYPLPADPAVTTGNLAIGASPGYAPVSSTDYQHNTVRFYIYNTSARTVRLDSAVFAWNKSGTYLDKVYREDTGACVFGTCAAGGSRSVSPVMISPAIELNGISGATCPSGNCRIPLRLVFTDSSGAVTSSQDMRFDDTGVQLKLTVTDLVYTRYFDNNGIPLPVQCTLPLPNIYSGVKDDVIVPAGPIVTDIREAWGAPETISTAGASVTYGSKNISSAYDVNVYAQINSSASLSKVVLYYAITSQSATQPPSAIGSYTAKPMLQTSSGAASPYTYALYNTATLTGSKIPAKKDKRIWYFVLIQDNDGNWERTPRVAASSFDIAYTYDQDNACATTPGPAQAFACQRYLNAQTGPDIKLEWTAPSLNTDLTAINDMAGFKLERSSDNGLSYSQIADVPGFNPGGIFSSIDPNPANGKYLYRVKVYDECALPKESSYYPTPACEAWKCGMPTAPVWDYSHLCKSLPTYPLDRTVTLPASTTGDLVSMKLYYCSDGSICATPTLIQTQTLPGVNAVGGIYSFDIPAPYGCGSWFEVSVVNRCGIEGVLSTP